MHLLAGPNGVGKSTLYALRIKPMTGAPFINADEIRVARAAAGEHVDGYEAAALAAAERKTCLEDGVSFVTETVFSHPSKLDLIERARTIGFRVVLYHLNVETVEIALARVRWRAYQGGHDVPEDKIRARYARNQALIRDAALQVERALVYDSSRAYAPPRWLLTLRHGHVVEAVADLPAWAQALYAL